MSTPKRQPYPASRIKVGAILYRAYSLVDEGKVESGFEEWIVRNIRARRNSMKLMGISLAGRGIEIPKVVNLARKTFSSWGKLSTKSGDFGWLPNTPSHCREQFRVGSDLPSGLYTTKRAALAYALASEIDSAEWYAGEIVKETDEGELLILRTELAEVNAQIAALQRRAKALSKESAKTAKDTA